jgi:hypothetical protein
MGSRILEEARQITKARVDAFYGKGVIVTARDGNARGGVLVELDGVEGATQTAHADRAYVRLTKQDAADLGALLGTISKAAF